MKLNLYCNGHEAGSYYNGLSKHRDPLLFVDICICFVFLVLCRHQLQHALLVIWPSISGHNVLCANTEPTSNTRFLDWIQDAAGIYPVFEIALCLFAKLKVLERNLTNEFVVLLKPVARLEVEVVKLHAGHSGLVCRTDSEGGHATSVDVERAIWEEVEE